MELKDLRVGDTIKFAIDCDDSGDAAYATAVIAGTDGPAHWPVRVKNMVWYGKDGSVLSSDPGDGLLMVEEIIEIIPKENPQGSYHDLEHFAREVMFEGIAQGAPLRQTIYRIMSKAAAWGNEEAKLGRYFGIGVFADDFDELVTTQTALTLERMFEGKPLRYTATEAVQAGAAFGYQVQVKRQK